MGIQDTGEMTATFWCPICGWRTFADGCQHLQPEKHSLAVPEPQEPPQERSHEMSEVQDNLSDRRGPVCSDDSLLSEVPEDREAVAHRLTAPSRLSAEALADDLRQYGLQVGPRSIAAIHAALSTAPAPPQGWQKAWRRCTATAGHPAVRCERTEGHSGEHVCGNIHKGSSYVWLPAPPEASR